MSYLVPDVLERFDARGANCASGFRFPPQREYLSPTISVIASIASVYVKRKMRSSMSCLPTLPEWGQHAVVRAVSAQLRGPQQISRRYRSIDASGGRGHIAANPSEKAKLGIGLIPSREPGGAVYDRLLSVEEACRRIDTYYWPYHRELEQALDRAQQLWGCLLAH